MDNDGWIDSGLPFGQMELDGEIPTTTHASPAWEGPAKCYRLIFKS